MRNWVRTAVISAVVAWSGGAVLAFDTSVPYINDYPNVPFGTGTCKLDSSVRGGTHTAYIWINGLNNLAGGAYWEAGALFNDPGYGVITAGAIEVCLGASAGTVTSLTQKGADAVSFEAQEYMGFSFILTEAAGGLDAGYHPYFIGTPPNSAPTANAGPDQASVASAATVTLDGLGSTDTDAGDALTYAWTQTDGTTVTLSDNNTTTAVQPTFTAPTLSIGVAAATLVFSLTVNDGTVDSTADTVLITVNPETASAASEFAVKEDAIRSVITNDAQRTLNSTVASNTRLTRDARGRFLTSRTQMQSDGAGLASRNNIALDVDGIAVATPEQLSTQGMFFAQTGNFEGTQRRLVFGDFDIQRDGDTGSTTATINGKVAWEQMLSEQTMLGYYLGGEVARSNIQGSFTGTQDKYGISVGGYFVHALQENLFLDGFASLGVGRNDLKMADDILDLTSDYTTRTATMGAAVSGVYEYGQYDFHPELAFSYGKTWIGDVGFTGVAYGLTDDTLSLDAGDVSIANLTLRPEIVWALDAETVADSNTQLSFAPRFICQRTSAAATTQDCGAGAEVGLSSTSEDGLGSANIRLVMDRVGNSNRSSFALNFDRSF